MDDWDERPKNPRCVAAGKKRRPWTFEDRQRLRQQCLAQKPWQHSTGPRTRAGKRRAAANGFWQQAHPLSVRSLRAQAGEIGELIGESVQLRTSMLELHRAAGD